MLLFSLLYVQTQFASCLYFAKMLPSILTTLYYSFINMSMNSFVNLILSGSFQGGLPY